MSKTNDDNKLAANPQRMSSQMQAVVRLLAGQEERTIAQKLADSNRPTWEQYKKDNHDHLNLDGVEQREMEKYRKQLDSEREKLLSRGRNHSKKVKKSRREESSEDSSDDSRSRERQRKHKKKRKRKRKRRHRDDSSSDDSDDSSESSETRRRKHRRKHKKQKKAKKKSSRKRNKESESESDGSHYRLSKFFDEGEGESDGDQRK